MRPRPPVPTLMKPRTSAVAHCVRSARRGAIAFAASVAVSWFAPLLPGAASAGDLVLREVNGDLRDSVVKIEAVFNTASNHGMLPYRVEITNKTSTDRVWRVSMAEGRRGRYLRTETEKAFSVPAGNTVQGTILLPFAPEFASSSYRMISTTVTTPGQRPEQRSISFNVPDTLPTIAMSSALAARSLVRLNRRAQSRNSSNQRFASQYSPAQLPADWRGYTGLDMFMIDFEAWEDLTRGVRSAILAWVRLGGQLSVFATPEEIDGRGLDILEIGPLEKPGRRGSVRTQSQFSLGSVELFEWDGEELEENLVDRWEREVTRSDDLGANYASGWPLVNQLGERSFHGPLILGVLFGFAVLVAPVNLFYFARKGKRHRLFFTVPVISLAACLVLVVTIVIGDGFGGEGYRAAVVDIQGGGEERRLYVTQEQISRTGVMLDQGFTTGTEVTLDPIYLPRNRFAAFTPASGREVVFFVEGNRFLGSFFSSRADQGFVLQSAEPSRNRVESAPASEEGSPRLTSILSSPVRWLAYRDESGDTWASPIDREIAPGETVTLKPLDPTLFRERVTEPAEALSSTFRKRIDSLAREPGRFFALPTEPGEWALETHPSLDWRETTVLITGGILSRPSPTDPPSQASLSDR